MSEASQPTVATDNPINVSDATEQQKLQAAQEIDNDPQVNEGGEPEGNGYDDLNLEELREELVKRDLPKSGNKAELISRLKDADTAKTAPGTEASANDDIELDYGLSGSHADVLQALSDERRAAQLAAVTEASPA